MHPPFGQVGLGGGQGIEVQTPLEHFVWVQLLESHGLDPTATHEVLQIILEQAEFVASSSMQGSL
jgi:hypothetical protein